MTLGWNFQVCGKDVPKSVTKKSSVPRPAIFGYYQEKRGGVQTPAGRQGIYICILYNPWSNKQAAAILSFSQFLMWVLLRRKRSLYFFFKVEPHCSHLSSWDGASSSQQWMSPGHPTGHVWARVGKVKQLRAGATPPIRRLRECNDYQCLNRRLFWGIINKKRLKILAPKKYVSF